jgi:hypothetical protein
MRDEQIREIGRHFEHVGRPVKRTLPGCEGVIENHDWIVAMETPEQIVSTVVVAAIQPA